MSNLQTRNALIESADIRMDRGIFLSAWLSLDYGGAGQGFGGYVLGGDPSVAAGKHDDQPNLAGEFIVGCMRAAGVETFSELKGKSVRVELGDGGWGAEIVGIGHIVKDDRWFRPKSRFAEMLGDRGFKP